MAPTVTSPAMGTSPVEDKKQIQNPNWHELNVRGLYLPKILGNIFTYRKVDRLNGPPVSFYLEYTLGDRYFFIDKRDREGDRER